MAAKVDKAKGVDFNYRQFFWGNISSIRGSQLKGDYSGALSAMATLVDYLPPDVKKVYSPRAVAIMDAIGDIQAGRIPQLRKFTDVYIRGNKRNQILQIFSSKMLSKFVSDLISTMNEKGYIETLDTTREGFGHTTREARA